MNQRLSTADTLGLGFMTFAFFLGAGNIIFPPYEGMQAGTNVFSAMFGFLITAVGMPLCAILAVAFAGGGLPKMTVDLPKGTGTFAAVVLFIIIGPAFAAPRTGLVAYEMAMKPLFHLYDVVDNRSFYIPRFQLRFDVVQVWSTALFFVVVMFLSWSRGKLIDSVGKILTPTLLLLLVCLAIGVVVNPQGDLQPPVGEYADVPFTKGFIGGYNTMDTFASLLFGILLLDILRGKGVTDIKASSRYLMRAGIVAALGLAFVYVSLFWLGATAGDVAPSANNGGTVLAGYVQALFGVYGQWVLSLVVMLACLTTAVGLVSACSDYFSSITPFRYRQWVIVLSFICAMVANVGLSRLIELSVPVLIALYPPVIALVALTFLRPKMRNRIVGFRLVIFVALLCSLLDALRHIGIKAEWAVWLLEKQQAYLPLAKQGMAWVLPTCIAIVIAMLIPGKVKNNDNGGSGETVINNSESKPESVMLKKS